MMMNEGDYRKQIQNVFDAIIRVVDAADVDPDVLECEQSQGSFTLRFASGSRCILSAQPSVRQLWMAVAAKGVAFHFDFNSATGLWADDKGLGIEPLAFLESYIAEATGLKLKFR